MSLKIGSAFISLLVLSSAGQADDRLAHLIKAHCRSVSSIVSMHLDLDTAYEFGGKEVNHYSYEWVYGLTDEAIRFKQETQTKMGEFTQLKFSYGNRSYYNGSRGYIALQDFDGQLIDGVLPPDSPASARIDGRQPAIGAGDGWVELGLRIGGTPSLALDDLSRDGEMRNHRRDSVTISKDGFDYEIVFDPDKAMMAGYKKSKNGKRYHQLMVEEFVEVPKFGYFPSRIRSVLSENDAELTIQTSVRVHSINTALKPSLFEVELPNEVPFFDAATGKSGIWGQGKPELYFASKDEAIAWGKEKSIRFANRVEKTSLNSTSLWLVALGVVLTLGLASFFVIRFFRERLEYRA